MKSLVEKLNILRDKVKFLRTILFGLLSGNVAIIFAFTQNKLIFNYKFDILLIIDMMTIIYFSYAIKKECKLINSLIRKLERIRSE